MQLAFRGEEKEDLRISSSKVGRLLSDKHAPSSDGVRPVETNFFFKDQFREP